MSRTLQHFIGLVVTGVIAEALLSAIALFHLNATGAYGVLANLFAIPWTSFVIMPLLVIALALDPLGIAHPVYWLLGKSMDALIWLANTVAAWLSASG